MVAGAEERTGCAEIRASESDTTNCEYTTQRAEVLGKKDNRESME